MDCIAKNLIIDKNSYKKKKKEDFLRENLKKNNKDFAQLEKEIKIQNDEIQEITKKCHILSEKSLKALDNQEDDETLENLNICAMGLSEIKSWLENSLKTDDLDSGTKDLITYFDNFNEMIERMEFIDSLENESQKTQKNFIEYLKQKREQHNK